MLPLLSGEERVGGEEQMCGPLGCLPVVPIASSSNVLGELNQFVE